MSFKTTYKVGIDRWAQELIAKRVKVLNPSETTAAKKCQEKKSDENAGSVVKEDIDYVKTALKTAGTDVLKKWEEESLSKVRASIDQADAALKEGRLLKASRMAKEALSSLKRIEEDAGRKEKADLEREYIVKCIASALSKMGFSIDVDLANPIDPGSDVVLLAGKPSGKCVETLVDLKGEVKTAFNGYENMACVKDIENFEQVLRERFGVKLAAQERIPLYPRKIASDAKRLPASKGFRSLQR